MTARAQVVAAARGWLGTRWQHQASARGVACDCAGLVAGVARELGLLAAELPAYQRAADGITMVALCAQHLQRIPRARLAPGDVAVFRFDVYPTHLAIVGDYLHGGLSLIHGLASARQVVEHAFDAAWRARLVDAFAFPGVIDEVRDE